MALGVTITHAGGTSFAVSVQNTSGETPFPLLLTPVLWAIHGSDTQLFQMGSPASEGLEKIAEDGDPSVFLDELAGLASVESSGAAGAAPASAGDSFMFEVTASSDAPMLSLLSMVVPSNDTFIALGATGVMLLDEMGSPRSDEEIATDIAALLAACDAGTEANQAGARGSDMAPWQAAPNTGASEGSGTVRRVNDLWLYPAIDTLTKVTMSIE